jgi:thioesterase domain-containing protein
MKTAEEWANWHDNRLPAEEIKQIQLDAMKEGMQRAARVTKQWKMADTAHDAILTAAEQLIESDIKI